MRGNETPGSQPCARHLRYLEARSVAEARAPAAGGAWALRTRDGAVEALRAGESGPACLRGVAASHAEDLQRAQGDGSQLAPGSLRHTAIHRLLLVPLAAWKPLCGRRFGDLRQAEASTAEGLQLFADVLGLPPSRKGWR